MPIHDWAGVDANLFHDFHQTWTINIRNALNGGLLPKGFSALVEQHAGGLVPDVIALQRRAAARADPAEPTAGRVVTATPPKTRHVIRRRGISAARGNRITIRHPLGRVVCVIEIVSPGNKGSRTALRSFVEKTVEFLRQGVHLLSWICSPRRPRPAGDPQGDLGRVSRTPFELPPDKPLTLAAYVAGVPKRRLCRAGRRRRRAAGHAGVPGRRTVTSRCRWKPPTRRPGRAARKTCARRSKWPADHFSTNAASGRTMRRRPLRSRRRCRSARRPPRRAAANRLPLGRRERAFAGGDVPSIVHTGGCRP